MPPTSPLHTFPYTLVSVKNLKKYFPVTEGMVFQRTVAKLDLPRIRLHDLRHTHATILLQQNVHPKVVSERLGHSSIAFTMTVYQHVMPGMQAEAAATFGAAVFGDS